MAEQRMNDAVNKMVDHLDRNMLRSIQKEGYLCSAKCLDDKNMSSEQLQACVERCQMPMQQVQHFLQMEMQTFQNRLQRCAMDCQDRARDSMPANGDVSDSKMTSIQNEMESCVNRCVDTHIKLLPTIAKRVEEAVQQTKQRK